MNKTTEILDLLSNQWLTAKDIQTLASCGICKAREIRKEISEQIKKDGKYLPSNKVPADKVIEYLGININYLKKLERR